MQRRSAKNAPLKCATARRDQNPGIERPKIPAETTLFGVLSESWGLRRLGGGRTRARTWDPMIKSHLLYQLSYAPGTGPEKPSQEGVV